MLQSWVTQLGACAVLAVCLYAMIAGTWRERLGGFIYISAYLLSLGFGLISTEHTTLYLLLVDSLCLQGFLVLSWKSPHPWPKWAMLGQLVCLGVAIAALTDFGIGRKGFMTIETAAGWGVLLALLIGTVAAAQARREAKAG